VVDLYTAEVLEMLGEFGKLPRPDWAGIKVVVTSAMARMYRRKGNEAFVERMVPFGISAKKLSATQEKWVVMVRPSLMRDYAGAVSNRTPPTFGVGRCGADIWTIRMEHWSASGSRTEEAAPTTFIRAVMRLRLFCDRSPTR
jgi:hypothetical protein